ncbi:uncharacterized protein LOC143446571 [Clavelina lepadiformis]|uniref:uncharacterized protein LOC143446571 n=1 Tax=Clavelina lepadiformis TaxID=159417 RepID=UPI00404175EE
MRKTVLLLLFVSQFIFFNIQSSDGIGNQKSPKFAKDDVMMPPVPPEFWSSDGECVDNPAFAQDCPVWAEKGYCTDHSKGRHYPKWMKRNCAASCKFCESGANWWRISFKIAIAGLCLAWATGCLPRGRRQKTRSTALRCAVLVLVCLALYLL